MAGPYAHITLLHELIRPGRLETIFSSTSGLDFVLANHFPYCALGGVSPDYPTLHRSNCNASLWADAMHYTHSCKMIESGIVRIKNAKGTIRDKQLAWLLGYCAHVATDMTIHPLVQAKVGVYAENQRDHRICEMNQDSYIYHRMNLGEIGESDDFARTVARCCNKMDITRLDNNIIVLWQGMLEDVHPELFAVHPPDIAAWHREFVAKATDFRIGEKRLFPLAGVIASKIGMSYPTYNSVDQQYIENLRIPSETSLTMHYEEVFERAAENIAMMWRQVELAICGEVLKHLPRFGDWNLDTGQDEESRLVFWD